jgi:hypothetical protein
MHIGQRIRQVYDAQPRQCSAGWLAARLHTDRTNVYNIFQRHDIDTGLLRRLSQILNHDFFADLSMALPSEEDDTENDDIFPTNVSSTGTATAASQQRTENQKLRV